MNTKLSPVLDILHSAETARKEGCRRACELLALDLASTIARILFEKDNEPRHQRLITLLEQVSQIVGDRKVHRNITDWPFENFWGNPFEPRHSKLLEYFLDPGQEHRCGIFLLQQLFEILKLHFPVDDRVRVKSGLIDVSIERDSDDGKYAVIIENKINSAADQYNQLQRYVDRTHQGGFRHDQIYVFYLPLTSDKHPDSGDLAAIQSYGVNYNQITFETHILKWLDKILDKHSEHERPKAMRDGMHENLSHYRSLLRYLIQKQKESKMNSEILKQLRLAEENNAPPTMSEIEALKQSTESLQQCMQHVLRGKLLRQIQALLRERGEQAWLCLENRPTEEIDFDSPYDERFDESVDVCVPGNDTVSVCFGGNASAFWLGYMRSGSGDKQKTIEPVILLEAKERLERFTPPWSWPWYAWANRHVTYSDNCVREISPVLANKLVEMRNRLVDRLKVEGVRS